jgi:CRP-like cAMP-binding protein
MESQVDPDSYRLKSHDFYDMLSAKEAAYVRQHETPLYFEKGQVLFRAGSYSKGVYIIKKGKVKIFTSSLRGPESIIYFYSSNEFFGHRPLLSNEAYAFTAVAMEHTEISLITADIFIEVMDSSPTLVKKLLTSVLSEFNIWINKITVFSQYSVRERVAISLLILAQIFEADGKSQQFPVIVINRTDLASFVGTAKETVVRTLRTFKDKKYITTRGSQITLLKPEALRQLLLQH